MPRDDTITLKRKIDSVINNINIYTRDLNETLIKLKTNYDIDDIDDIDELIDESEKSIGKLDKKRERLLQRATKLLGDIPNA